MILSRELPLHVLFGLVRFSHDDSPDQQEDTQRQEEVDPTRRTGDERTNGPHDQHRDGRNDQRIHS